MKVAVVGSGSWATALSKLLTDNEHQIYWWFRSDTAMAHFQQRGHNPTYLSKAFFDVEKIVFSADLSFVVEKADIILIATPSAFVPQALERLPKDALKEKTVLSAVKGIVPGSTELLSDYLLRKFQVPLKNYFTLLGPCHAEEVASEKLSYLTFSGLDKDRCHELAALFQTSYLNTRINQDVIGVQYAAVLKNIYALGAGIAHGLDYGDNFLSVYIACAADEMAGFLKRVTSSSDLPEKPNYSTSVYLGDLLVTCYSLYSRNRMFGTMIGKGYSVKAAQLELGMVAEGFNASKCIFELNQKIEAQTPIAEAIYDILWHDASAEDTFLQLETVLK